MTRLLRSIIGFGLGFGVSMIVGYRLRQQDRKTEANATTTTPKPVAKPSTTTEKKAEPVVTEPKLDTATSATSEDNATAAEIPADVPEPESEDIAVPESEDESEIIEAATKIATAAAVAEPKAVQEEDDDLTVIKGIGGKTAEVLAENGFDSYASLASITPEALLATLEGKVRGINLDKVAAWIEEAGDLAT